MIFLKSIYSEPMGLFETVEFHDGINMIYGKYSKSADKKDSLNSIGKSTLVNLINFCLMSSFDKRSPLYKAKKILDSYHIVLEIEVDYNVYIIKRTSNNPSKIFFGRKNSVQEMYDIEAARRILCDMFFFDEAYDGIYSNKWFRQLVTLFIRNEKTGYGKLPILYIDRVSELKLVPHNLFLLGINNKLAYENYKLRTDLKGKKKTQDGIKKILEDTYSITNIADINAKISNIKDDIVGFEENISMFSLGLSYKDREQEADKFTEEIKKYVKLNYSSLLKLGKYKDSLKLEINISPEKIEKIYYEINEDLGIKVRKTLEDAISFKQRLISSRTNFLKSEIISLEESIKINNEKIAELDKERSKILNYLKDEGAIKDLTEAVNMVNKKRETASELSGKLKLYNDLESDILSIKQQESSLNIDIKMFITSIENNIGKLRRVFNSIYNELYTKTGEGIFNISFAGTRKDAKIEVKAITPDSQGWGKSRGCILTYDLTVFFNAIFHNKRMPRFLVHDGIYNGVDRSQFISTMNFLNELSNTYRFQYIFTANEDEVWVNDTKTNQYGILDVNLDKCIVAEYSENSKIFKKDF
jgi:uncharacterized protein YydD (DUF2326 family)